METLKEVSSRIRFHREIDTDLHIDSKEDVEENWGKFQGAQNLRDRKKHAIGTNAHRRW